MYLSGTCTLEFQTQPKAVLYTVISLNKASEFDGFKICNFKTFEVLLKFCKTVLKRTYTFKPFCFGGLYI